VKFTLACALQANAFDRLAASDHQPILLTIDKLEDLYGKEGSQYCNTNNTFTRRFNGTSNTAKTYANSREHA